MKAALRWNAGLLAAALGFAWIMSNRAADHGGPSESKLLDCQPGEVTRIAYTWPQGTTVTTSVGTDKQRRVVVDVERDVIVKPEVAPPHTDGGVIDDAVPPTTKHESAHVPAGKTVLASLELLEPLKARRTLGDVDDAREKAMGLDKPQRTLAITTAGKTLTLDVGEASYGAQGRYVRVHGERAVRLIDNAIVNGLEGGADTLMERRVVVEAPEDIAALLVQVGDKSATFMHVDRDQPQKQHFARKDDPTGKSDEANQVLTTLRGLRVTSWSVANGRALGPVVATCQLDVGGHVRTLALHDPAPGGTPTDASTIEVDGLVGDLNAAQSKELLEDARAALRDVK
jgi:hypothetical protein